MQRLTREDYCDWPGDCLPAVLRLTYGTDKSVPYIILFNVGKAFMPSASNV